MGNACPFCYGWFDSWASIDRQRFWIGGIVIAVLTSAAPVVVGIASFGQALAGVGFALLLFFYVSFTPILFRVIDLVLNIIAGVIVFFVVKIVVDPQADMDPSASYLVGIGWMIFSMLCLILLYKRRNLSKFVIFRVEKLNEDSVIDTVSLLGQRNNDHLSETFFVERRILTILVSLLFVFLALMRVFTPYLNQTLAKR